MARRFVPSGPPSELMATVYDYGGGLVEASWYEVRDFDTSRPKAERGESANREENELFAIRRAKSKARRLILTLRPTSLGTTTFSLRVDRA